jgi:hypothetical protein
MVMASVGHVHSFRGQEEKEKGHVVIRHDPASVAEAHEQIPAFVLLTSTV